MGRRDEFTTASLSPHGAQAYFSGERGLSAVDLRTGARRVGPPDVVFAAVSPSGVVVGATASGRIDFYDPATFTADGRSLRGLPGEVDHFAFSSDGNTMATRTTSGALHLVDVGSRTHLGGPITLVGGQRSFALRPDGRELAVPGPDGVLLWDLDAAVLAGAACAYAGRDLTSAERRAHLLEDHEVCPAR